MKETGQSYAPKELPPSLADTVKARISEWWKSRNPLSPDNEVSKTWRQELIRVAQSFDRIGSPEFGTRLLRTMTEPASRLAGAGAFVGDMVLGIVLTGWGGNFLLNRSARSAYLNRHKDDLINLVISLNNRLNVLSFGRIGLGIGVASYGPLSHLSMLTARVGGGLADVEADAYLAVKNRITK